MNLELNEANSLFKELNSYSGWPNDVQMMIFPPAIYVHGFVSQKKDSMEVGLQNFHSKEKGAFTGEISFSQAKSIGVNTLLVGHSERRAYFGENEAILKEKVDAGISNGSTVVFCCGEPLEIREKNEQNDFVKKQLEDSLFHLTSEEMKQVVIAYEPVWAIGTGKTASVEQAEEMHAEIRSWLSSKYGESTAESTSILYGGSCNEKNAQELFACPNVDGGLIGGASLKSESFLKIAQSY